MYYHFNQSLIFDKRIRFCTQFFYIFRRNAPLDIPAFIWYNGHITKTTVRLARKDSGGTHTMSDKSVYERSWVVVDSSVLPEVILKTLTVKRMLANREEKSSSAACRAVGISRSAFYKYRDSVFIYEEQMRNQIFTIYLILHDEAGILSGVLHTLSDANANVLTLNQSIPVDGAAAVTITFRLQESANVSALCSSLGERKGVVEVRLLSGS